MSANDKQISGDHYKMGIEPWDAIIAWGLGYLDGNAVKYLSRWRKKGGVADLEKAKHYIEKLIENERLRRTHDYDRQNHESHPQGETQRQPPRVPRFSHASDGGGEPFRAVPATSRIDCYGQPTRLSDII